MRRGDLISACALLFSSLLCSTTWILFTASVMNLDNVDLYISHTLCSVCRLAITSFPLLLITQFWSQLKWVIDLPMMYEGDTRGVWRNPGHIESVHDQHSNWLAMEDSSEVLCVPEDCETKWFNRVNSPGTLPTEVDDSDKESLISRPYGTRHCKAHAEMFHPKLNVLTWLELGLFSN